MRAISFDVSSADDQLIKQIAARAYSMNPDIAEWSYVLDIRATHANGCSLRLADLLTAGDLNFAHDVGGIGRYLNRKTGRLENFEPRFVVQRNGMPLGQEGPLMWRP